MKRAPIQRRLLGLKRLKQYVGFALRACFPSLISLAGCAHVDRQPQPSVAPETISVAVAPVLNLSNSRDWDVLKVTDLVASELQSFPGVTVIPVNRTLALLAEENRAGVESADDAIWLARELQADAAVVVAITEYNPYDPPIVGLILQLYSVGRSGVSALDPVAASREATDFAPSAEAGGSGGPLQIQRVFNASDGRVLREMKRYAEERSARASAYGWRVHEKSQELFIRFSLWSAIRSMLWARAQCGTDAGLGADEADDG
ncbi:MAG: hypothetical protein HZB38_14190 [Planctomycetes bacterium]|nr:hypothetical protein [Planctomycetota bacterium]